MDSQPTSKGGQQSYEVVGKSSIQSDSDYDFDVKPRVKHWVNQLLRWRYFLLAASLLAGIAAFPVSQSLQFDRSLERLFHESDPRLKNYIESKEIFGAQETCFIAYSDPSLVSAEGMERLEQFGAKLSAVPGVDSITSLAGMRLPSNPMSGQSFKQMLQDGSISSQALQAELVGSDLYRNRLISSDGTTTAIVVTLKLLEDTPDQPRAQTIEKLRQVAQENSFETVVAGGSVLVDDVFSHLENDGQKLGIYSTLVMTLVIAIMFRNLRWMLMPLLVVHLALVWTKALMVLSGLKLSMVSSPLVALVTVIGVGTVVHFAIRFREYRATLDPVNALRGTLSHVGPATFWTILTTVGGFASLMVSRIVPVQSFGLMMSLGTFLVMVAIFGLISGATLLGRASSDPMHAPGEDKVALLLNWIMAAVERHPWWFAISGLAALGFLSIGTTKLESATDFTDNFHEDSPIVQSYQFISSKLGTTGGYDLLIDSPDIKAPEFNDFIKTIEQIQTELASVPGVSGSMSIPDLLRFLKGKPGREPQTLTERLMAGAINTPARNQLQLLTKFEPGLVSGFWNKDRNVMRISVMTGDLAGNQAKLDRLDAIESIGRKYSPSARTAGAEILIMFLVSSMLSDQWITFAVAVIAIVVMLTISFRSVGLALLALIPNASPILIVIGTMGWLGLKMNMATAMLASVSMGLAVDFSIHYLYRFRHELKSGRDFDSAIRQAHGTVGLAIILANLALIAGFMVLTLSDFVPTVQFGFLVTIVMLGGLTANLLILPMLLRTLRVIWPSSIGQ